MSHFTVLVIGDDVAGLLEPHNENTQVAQYVEYTKEQLINKERKSIKDYESGIYAEYLANPIEYAADCRAEHLEYIRDEFPKKLNWTDEQVYQDAIKYYEPEGLSPCGGVFSTRNPLSQWDWYQIGGRWAGQFIVKPEFKFLYAAAPNFSYDWSEEQKAEAMRQPRADSVLKSHVDWEKMLDREAYNKAIRFWQLRVEESPTLDESDKKLLRENWDSAAYLTKFFDNKEDYADDYAAFRTFAVLDANGWHSSGDMGWFGIDLSEVEAKKAYRKGWFDRFIQPLADNERLTVVDCHI